MDVPYINIHTHKKQENAEKVWYILNRFASEWSDHGSEEWYSVGVHPWYIESEEKANIQLHTTDEALSHQQCIAAGEAGLDKIARTDMKLQEEIFAAQVKLSEKHGKPLIIHCVKAYSELLALRKELKAQQVWIFHGFNSSYEMARQIIDHGCMLSFGKLLMKDGSKAELVIRRIEPRYWFLETDDEDISIESVYEKAAHITHQQVDELKSAIQENFNRIFKISTAE